MKALGFTLAVSLFSVVASAATPIDGFIDLLRTKPSADAVEKFLAAHPSMPIDGRAKCQTPLMYASTSSTADVVRVLLAHKANYKLTDCSGNTALALLWVNSPDNAVEIAKVLVAAGANIEAKNDLDQTPLTSTVSADFFGNEAPLEKELVSLGASLTATSHFGKSVLAQAESDEAVTTLLALGADANARDTDGKSVFMDVSDNISTSAKGLTTASLDALIAAGASVNTPDRFHYTALISCSLGCSAQQIKFLLQRGANKCARSDDGTAYDMAVNYERPREILKLLSGCHSK